MSSVAIAPPDAHVPADCLEELRAEIEQHPDVSRSHLARWLCERLDWRNRLGRPRVVAARVALLALEREGAVKLPAARAAPPRAARHRKPEPAEIGQPLECVLADLGRIELVPASSGTPKLLAEAHRLLAGFHQLGNAPLAGDQLRYLIRHEQVTLGVIAFACSARALADRDRWIGWSPNVRKAHRHLVVGNARFLILPWVRVPNLASKVLAAAERRLPHDWVERFGYRPVLLESFVDESRQGTSYRAANWIQVGMTAGRGRQDRSHLGLVSKKKIFLRPLRPDFREFLCAPLAPGEQQEVAQPNAVSVPGQTQDWAEDEFGAAQLGDTRRTRRLVTLARDLFNKPQANLPQACGSRAKLKAAYRFFADNHVTLPQILQPHYDATATRVAKVPRILAVQDSTSLNYLAHPATEGLGPICGNSKKPGQGILLHCTLAFTPERVPLGLIDVQAWVRSHEKSSLSASKKERLPIEQKESNKWLKSYRASRDLQRRCPGTKVVSIGDRENDLHEIFVLAKEEENSPDLLVRAWAPRKLSGQQTKVMDYMALQPEDGTKEFEVPKRRGEPRRTARVSIRYATVTLEPPQRKNKLPAIEVDVVLVREEDPPEGVKEPLSWLLYTTVPVRCIADAEERIEWYRARWEIEVYHRTLKSGCRIEERQLATELRLENCLAIDLVVAWRILHLTKLGREQPNAPCTIVFEDHQWKALWAFIHRSPKVPTRVPTLGEVTKLIAGLGGFLGRKGDGDPGCKSLWLGSQRLDDIDWAWLAFGPESEARTAGPTSPVSSAERSG